MQDRRRQFDEIFLQRAAGPYIGSKTEVAALRRDVCFTPNNGHRTDIPGGPFCADIAKVENRTTLKISRKSIFGLLCCCVAFQRRYGGP
jgi:hypothetical protein